MPKRPSTAPQATPRKPSLSRERIVETALDLASEHGPDGLSLRAVARKLSVTPMALYRHIPNKQALMDEVRHFVQAPRRPTTVSTEEPLTKEQVVREALHLVAQRGLAGLSMRSLAARLNVTPMSIYRHVANKQALLSAMTDVILDDMPRPEATPDNWEARFREHAREVWTRFSAYPGLVGSFASGPSSRVLDHMRYERAALLTSGVDARTASIAITVYHTFMLGLFRTHAYLDRLTHIDDNAAGVDPSLLRRYGDRLRLTELLDFALDAVVAALKERTGRTPSA